MASKLMSRMKMLINLIRRLMTTSFAAELLPSVDKDCAATIDSMMEAPMNFDTSYELKVATHCNHSVGKDLNYIVCKEMSKKFMFEKISK